MAQPTSTAISINGKAVNQFSRLSLTQGIYEHHYFRLTCPASAIDSKEGAIFNQSQNLMGANITILIKSLTSNEHLKFVGVVTQIDTERHGGSQGNVVLSGYSPTIVLESGPHCKTWEKKAVKNIVQDVLKHFPQNLLKPKVASRYPETLAYYVQYKETAWRFLNRICSQYGEWLYFDGQQLIVGAPTGPTTPLLFGDNLSRFSMSLEVRPPQQQVMAYNYMDHEVYTSSPTGIASKAGFNEFGNIAYKASEELYSTVPKMWNNSYLTNKKQLDETVNIQNAMRSSNQVRFNGSSGSLSLQVGGGISVSGQNIFTQSKESYGNYTILSVNHDTDGQGNYNNDFVAVPSSINYPPVPTLPQPVCETQSAIVTDNHDPQGLGRVRVRFHWMKPSEKTPWIRVTSPHGGGGKGMFFIPETGEEAIICFEGNSPLKPFVNGTVYHGKAKTDFANAGNDVKALQTRSGNKVVMNDKDGSVFIEDKDGNNLLFDGAGNAILKTNESITLTCGESTIIMKKDGTIAINGKDIISIATEGIASQAKNIGMSADEKLIGTAKDTGFSGDDSLSILSKKLSALGSVTATLNGAKIDIAADGDCTVNAGLLKLNS